ncbi:oxidoreductase [Candidatus Binatia bacterium]|nr:oxidoreductase [Candidatus Binatia bacterium]
MKTSSKPSVAVIKFASCDGCQLQFLNAEDELLALAQLVDLAYFPEARSREVRGPYDVTFVEGSVSTPDDARRIVGVRAATRWLVSIGACATSGGIQALRNWANIEDYKRIVYPSPEFISTLSTSTPIAEHVRVDFELWGCPIDKDQLLTVVRSLISGAAPVLPGHALCLECKRRGLTCVSVAAAQPCLGPITRTGCGAVCPSVGRGCYGCFGPVDDPNMNAFAELLERQGLSRDECVRRLRLMNGYLRPMRDTSDAIENRPVTKH